MTIVTTLMIARSIMAMAVLAMTMRLTIMSHLLGFLGRGGRLPRAAEQVSPQAYEDADLFDWHGAWRFHGRRWGDGGRRHRCDHRRRRIRLFISIADILHGHGGLRGDQVTEI